MIWKMSKTVHDGAPAALSIDGLQQFFVKYKFQTFVNLFIYVFWIIVVHFHQRYLWTDYFWTEVFECLTNSWKTEMLVFQYLNKYVNIMSPNYFKKYRWLAIGLVIIQYCDRCKCWQIDRPGLMSWLLLIVQFHTTDIHGPLTVFVW